MKRNPDIHGVSRDHIASKYQLVKIEVSLQRAERQKTFSWISDWNNHLAGVESILLYHYSSNDQYDQYVLLFQLQLEDWCLVLLKICAGPELKMSYHVQKLWYISKQQAQLVI